MTPPPGLPFEYFAAATIYGAWVATIIHSAADAWTDWRRHRGQRYNSVASVDRNRLLFDKARLRIRPMSYKYGDLGDTPYVAPQHNGTDTSKAAAASIRSTVGKQSAQVLSLIRQAGTRGLITDEAEEITGGKHQAISARFNDLANAGLIYCNLDDRTDRRPTRSGRSARIYRAIEFKDQAQRPVAAE